MAWPYDDSPPDAEDGAKVKLRFNFSSVEEALQTLRAVIRVLLSKNNTEVAAVPIEFMEALRIAIKYEPVRNMLDQSLGSLSKFHYDAERNDFDQIWDLNTVRIATVRMEEWLVNQAAAKTVPRRRRANNSASSSISEAAVLKKWQILIGNSLYTIITHQEFMKINEVLVTNQPSTNTESFEKNVLQGGPPLTVRDLSHWISKLLPYVLQKIKMWGCGILEPENLKRLVPDIEMHTQQTNVAKKGPPKFVRKSASVTKKESRTNQTFNDVVSVKVPFSRLDLLVCLINRVDVMTKLDILRNISAFPFALPLIIPSLYEDKMINLLSLLKFIPLRKKKPNGDIVENYLFDPTFKLILCVRLGDTKTVGKSSILNRVLKRSWTFSSKQEPGAILGKPVSLPGLVEFVAITQETCSTDLWEEIERVIGDEDIVLLGNMHGDPAEHPEVFRTVLALAAGVIVFTMPEVNDAEVSESIWNEISETFDAEVPYLEVDDFNEEEESENSIRTNDLTNNVTLNKVRKSITKALTLKRTTVQQPITQNYHCSSYKVRSVEDIECHESTDLANLLNDNSLSEIKSVLSLNKPEPSSSSQLEEISLRAEVVGKFYSLLKLPAEKRLLAMVHLEKELASNTKRHSFGILNELLKYEKEFATLPEGEENENRRQELKLLINSQKDSLNEINLGLEHFYRKIGKIYESALLNQNDANYSRLMKLPSYYAELLMHGHSVELLDGESDSPTIYATWFTAICEKINEARPNLRIFVVSVVGLQSSGKSTLLNALFGCRFAVSMGRCTKGLYLQLLFLDEHLRNELNTDAIFIIDMEGLCSPEMVNDPKAEIKDRFMTTYVMGISNLTLINISGESSNSMTEILQIGIIAMSRLQDANLSPDLFVVQHLSEKNTQKVVSAHKEFICAIQQAITTTEERGIDIGIRNSASLENLMSLVRKGNVLKAFGPFRNGEFISSPPSSGYHDSISSLYKSILEACKERKSPTIFNSWYRLLNGYLDAVLSENVAVRFKNLIEMCEHLDRRNKINETKDEIEKAFRKHASNLEPEIRGKIRSYQQNNARKENAAQNSKFESRLLGEIESKLKLLPYKCEEDVGNLPCVLCKYALDKIESLFSHVRDTPVQADTTKTITDFVSTTSESSVNRLRNMIGSELILQGLSKEFCEILNECLQKFVTDENSNSRSDDECEAISKEVWKELHRKVSERYEYVDIKSRIEEAILNTYVNYPEAVSLYTENVDLQNECAYKGKKFKVVPEPKPLKAADYFDLISRLNGLPDAFANRYPGIQHVVPGIMNTVEKMVTEEIRKFEEVKKISLMADYKCHVHVYCLNLFGKFLERLEKKWESYNQPTKVLEKNKDLYVNLIEMRLKHRFSAVGEGHVIANILVRVVQENAEKHGANFQRGKILDLPWMLNAENIRLCYFSILAREVNDGKLQNALVYFRNPKSQISIWFRNQVNNLYVEESYEECRKMFRNEITLVIQTIKNKETMKDIKKYLDEYCNQVGRSITYQSTLKGGEKIRDASLDLLKRTIEESLKSKLDAVESELSLAIPSSSGRVWNRIGCTEHCYWCGALCWGQRGHERNSDSTKCHHACHQPGGLIGMNGKHDCMLVSYSCQDYDDYQKHFWGEFKESGILWKDTKNHDKFKNWLFDGHTKVEFNQLMYWFFKKLNTTLAKNYGALPCPDEEFNSKSTYSALNSVRLEEILASISQKIRSNF